ncbi:MAG: DUF5317 domain-containing protein [Actinomycetota bacterium]
MLLIICFVLCVASVPLAGGRLVALADFPLHQVWAVFAAISLQIAIINVFPGIGTSYVALHLASYAFLIWFLRSNRKLPGLWVTAMGTIMNFTAIATNGGVMPATPGALRTAGMNISSAQFANSAQVADPNYAFLGDVFATPAAFPFANVFSAGDICIVVGALLTLHQMCATRFFPPRPTLTPLQSLDTSV